MGMEVPGEEQLELLQLKPQCCSEEESREDWALLPRELLEVLCPIKSVCVSTHSQQALGPACHTVAPPCACSTACMQSNSRSYCNRGPSRHRVELHSRGRLPPHQLPGTSKLTGQGCAQSSRGALLSMMPDAYVPPPLFSLRGPEADWGESAGS